MLKQKQADECQSHTLLLAKEHYPSPPWRLSARAKQCKKRNFNAFKKQFVLSLPDPLLLEVDPDLLIDTGAVTQANLAQTQGLHRVRIGQLLPTLAGRSTNTLAIRVWADRIAFRVHETRETTETLESRGHQRAQHALRYAMKFSNIRPQISWPQTVNCSTVQRIPENSPDVHACLTT